MCTAQNWLQFMWSISPVNNQIHKSISEIDTTFAPKKKQQQFKTEHINEIMM